MTISMKLCSVAFAAVVSLGGMVPGLSRLKAATLFPDGTEAGADAGGLILIAALGPQTPQMRHLGMPPR